VIDCSQQALGFCHVLRHDGATTAITSSQLTYLLFIKIGELSAALNLPANTTAISAQAVRVSDLLDT